METKEPMPFYLAAGRCKRSFTCFSKANWFEKSTQDCVLTYFVMLAHHELKEKIIHANQIAGFVNGIKSN